MTKEVAVAVAEEAAAEVKASVVYQTAGYVVSKRKKPPA